MQSRYTKLMLLPVLLGACDRSVAGPERATPAHRHSESTAGVPTRSDPWRSASSDVLWKEIAGYDSSALVGIKAPGSARGFYEGAWLIDRGALNAAVTAVRNVPGIGLTEIDGKLPLVRVRVASVQALERLRTLPFIDYVEPPLLRSTNGAAGTPVNSALRGLGASFSSGSSGGSTTYGSYVDAEGNRIPNIYPRMRVPEAWTLSTGAGVTVGLVDTGVDVGNPELGAWQVFRGSPADSHADENGHGTHLAGVIGAPRNGSYIVGVSYGANFVAGKHGDGYLDVDAGRVNAAMDSVIGHGARIVNFSLRSDNTSSAVSDRLSYYYHQHNILFTGAAGTGRFGTQVNYLYGVVFPASDIHVIAVAAVAYDSDAPDSESHYGPEVELSAPQGQPATGTAGEGYFNATTRGTSNSSALVSAIAALAWSRYPHLSNAQLRERLRVGARDLGPIGRDPQYGYGIINAFAVVGGFYRSTVVGTKWHDDCAVTTDPNRTCFANYESTACFSETFRVIANGDGPFTYRWSTGSTSDRTTVTLCPSQDYDTSVQVQVKDGLQNRTLTTTVYVRVDGGGTSNCDPNLDPRCPG